MSCFFFFPNRSTVDVWVSIYCVVSTLFEFINEGCGSDERRRELRVFSHQTCLQGDFRESQKMSLLTTSLDVYRMRLS